MGGTIEYYRGPALVTLRDIEESSLRVYGLLIDIARPTEHNQNIPSLLGQDILRSWRVIHDRLANDLTLEVHLADFNAAV